MTDRWPWQERGLHELSRGKRALFMPYGAGKSRVALEYALTLDSNKPRWVIFCKPHNVNSWLKQINTWTSEAIHVSLVYGTREERERTYEQLDSQDTREAPWVAIIPYSVLVVDAARIVPWLEEAQPSCIIADESTSFKTHTTRTAKLMVDLSFRVVEVPRIIMTGNPIPESKTEIWPQFQVAYGPKISSIWGRTLYQFLRRYFVRTDYGYQLKMSMEEAYQEQLNNFCVALSSDEKDQLKTVVGSQERYLIEYYSLMPAQVKALEDLFRDWELVFEDGNYVEYDWVTTLWVKAQQICDGFVYRDDNKIEWLVKPERSPKLLLCREVLEQLFNERADRKVVIWTHLRALRNELIKILNNSAVDCVYDNEPPSLRAFEDPEGPQIIVLPVEASEGMNELVVADSMIFFGNTFSSEKRDQAERRLLRPGQKAPWVNIIDLCAPRARDEAIITALQSKRFNSGLASAYYNALRR
jgi:hypothetical protein